MKIVNMNFSYEELYSMYGQYDTFISIVFHRESDSYKNFGSTLMGGIKYTLEERIKLESVLKKTEIPRTESEIRFIPSELEKLEKEQIEFLDKTGFLCSDIFEVSSVNLPRKNRFTEKKKKEILNTINIEMDSRDWQDLNRITFGFLNSRFEKGNQLSPDEVNQYLGLREYYRKSNKTKPFKDLAYKKDQVTLKDEVRFYELKSKFDDLVIDEDEMKEFAQQVISKHSKREHLINKEFQKSTEKLKQLSTEFGDQIENLNNICHKYEERVILFGEKLIFLNFERFLHIFIRHTTETQIGDRFQGKTVFQYNFDDIIRIISLVMDVASNEIQEHFMNHPESNYRRMGKRSIYFDGHYYRVEIDFNGSLLTFHPYNNNEEKEADNEE
jgi:hypothetical protein